MQVNNENKSLKLSSSNPVLRVAGGSVIKGEKGDKGDTGLQGPVGPQGPKGDQGLEGKPGRDGIDGKDGQDGKGIKSITLIDTKDKVKTYRIEYTDGTSFDFQVKDGEDGLDGKGMSGGAVLKGAEKTSRKTDSYTETSSEKYPSSAALNAAIVQLRSEITQADTTIIFRRWS